MNGVRQSSEREFVIKTELYYILAGGKDIIMVKIILIIISLQEQNILAGARI